MTFALASGKGGTGKTFVAVNLAAMHKDPVFLLDCDVEEPNDLLFLSEGEETQETQETVTIAVPQLDASLCDGCGICSHVCEFNAIAMIAKKTMIFDELCHACGACIRFCPQHALAEKDHRIGNITTRQVGPITVVQGKLDIGIAMAVPLIRAVKRHVPESQAIPVIIDAPPGTSCPMVWSVSGCDAAVLVTEPTPFGLHDLTLALDTVREMDIPFGVVVNKVGIGDDRVQIYCHEHGVPVLAEFPYDRRIAQVYAKGELVVERLPQYRETFQGLLQAIYRLANVEDPDGKE